MPDFGNRTRSSFFHRLFYFWEPSRGYLHYICGVWPRPRCVAGRLLKP